MGRGEVTAKPVAPAKGLFGEASGLPNREADDDFLPSRCLAVLYGLG